MKRFTRTSTTARRLVVGLALIAALATGGATGADAASDEDSGWARFGHFAPGATAVDVWVDGEPFATNIGFKMVSDYRPLSSGVHSFSLRATSDPDGPVLLEVQARVPAGNAVTVSAVSSRDGVGPQVFDDALSAPAAGRSLVRFIHAAPDAPAVEIAVRGGPVLAEVPYPAASEYLDIAPGSYDVIISDATTGDPVLEVDGWTIEPGVQATIAVVAGEDGRLDVAPVVDAAAVATAPAGGVQTGYGGMSEALSPSGSVTSAAAPAVLGVSAVAALMIARSARRRRLRTSSR